jgi:hypothetical protein
MQQVTALAIAVFVAAAPVGSAPVASQVSTSGRRFVTRISQRIPTAGSSTEFGNPERCPWMPGWRS